MPWQWLTTELDIAAEAACSLVQKPAVFRHVVWPIFTVGGVPDHLDEGEEIAARLLLFRPPPRLAAPSQAVSIGPREIYSNEHGGPVSTWNHRLIFEPTSESSCRHTDRVEIEAGAMTLPTILFAHLIYRWRHRRWRALTRLLPHSLAVIPDHVVPPGDRGCEQPQHPRRGPR